MGNMSYCRFENTSGDLYDCVTALEEVGSFEELDLSEREADAAEGMLRLCQRYIDCYYDLQGRAEADLELEDAE